MAIAGRRKLILAIKTFNRKDYLRHCLDSFEKTADRRHSWVVVIADDGSTDGTREMLKTLRIPFELHVIYNDRRFAVGQTNTLFDLASRLGFDVGFAIDDDVIFRKPGWEQLYLQAIEASGYAHLCHLNLPHWRELRAKQKPGQAEPKAMTDQSGTCEARVSVNECMGCLYTFTPEVLRVVGGCDEANFPIRGQWHQDWSARAARAGFNVVNTFFDAREASDYIDLQNNVDETYRAAIPWGPEYAKTRDAGELARRRALVRDASRCFVPIPRPTPSVKGDNVNDVFERIVMLNLDRRPDRLEIMTRRLERTGIRWERFAAIDGQNPECGAAYEAYLAGQPWQQIADEMALPRNSLAFYRENFSEVVRARFIAKRSRQAPIATAGAWGYLRSMERILSDALRDGIDSLLVFDDDCRFHRDFKALFAAGMAEVPTDWVILQLGALQHDWGTSWTETFSSHLYRCRGTSVGSHATGMKAEAFPVLLEHCHRNQLPYDLGALNVAKRLFADTSLTFLPNLAIQDDSRSDIGSSVLPLCNRNKEGNVFGWTIADYEDAGRGSAQHDGRS
jgi:glycosyltransferase involved in cell wall biosynthesis/GR25 family glycosyltransferase involved in LPS biosynthesis